MPWNGSGLAQRVHNWTQDKINNIKILASRFDEENDDFAEMITNTLTKDGQNSPIVDLPMGGQKHTGVGDADARDNYLPVGQYQDGFAVWGVDTGTADALAVILSPPVPAYTAGMSVRILKGASANTGQATINLNLIGDVDIIRNDGSVLEAGDQPASAILALTYDGTAFRQNSPEPPTSPWVPNGLKLSNDIDTDHDVNVAAGSVRDATNAVNMVLPSEITKQIDAPWSAGDDAGGLDTGTVAVSSLYAVWLIKRSDTAVVDMLFSLSFSSPTMPVNYDFKRLIGAVVTDSSANIVAFTNSGDEFYYTGGYVSDVSDSGIVSNTFAPGTLSVPPNCRAFVAAGVSNSGDSDQFMRLMLKTKGATSLATTNNEAWIRILNSPAASFDAISNQGTLMVDANSQIEYATNETTGTATITVKTIGFTMNTRSQP